MRFLKNLPNNIYVQFAGALSIILGPALDAISTSNVYVYIGLGFAILFLIGVHEEYKKNKKFEKELIHFPIVIKIDNGPNEKFAMKLLMWQIEQSEKLSNYQEDLLTYYHLDVDSYIFTYRGDIFDRDKLFTFMHIIRYKIEEIERRLEGRVKFHIAYYRRPAIGFMIGTLFRTEAIKLYQNNDTKNIFEMVCDVNTRKYKEATQLTKYTITKDFRKSEDEVLIVINSASHNVNIQASSLKKFNNTVVLQLIEKGTIPYDASWDEYSSQIYTVINELQTQFKKITIAHSMPEALAILLGMAMENYWDVNITQYVNQDYKTMYNLKEIVFL